MKKSKLLISTLTIASLGASAAPMLAMTGCGCGKPQITIKDIKVVTPPSKVNYAAGEKLDLSGLKATATYTDGTTKDLTNQTEGLTTDPSVDTPLTKGLTKVTVTYDGKQDTFDITVSDATVTNIEVVSAPSKVTYAAGEKLALTGLKAKATYTDGSTKDLTDQTPGLTTDPSVDTPLTKGLSEVTVSYGNKQDTFGITVGDAVVTSIEVETAPTKVEYAAGEKLNLDGLKIQATYTDGTTEELTGATEGLTTDPSVDTPLTKGLTKVTVSYSGKQCTFDITVGDAAVTSIEVKTSPTKDNYKIGEKLDYTGFELTAHTTEGDKTISKDECTFSIPEGDLVNEDSIVEGKISITVEYGGKSTKFDREATTEIIPLEFVADSSFNLLLNFDSGYGKGWNGTLQYSTDGETWTDFEETTVVTSSSDNKVWLRGTGNNSFYSHEEESIYTNLVFASGSGEPIEVSCEGDIRALLNYEDVNEVSMSDYCFSYLFDSCDSLVKAPALPSKELAPFCYQQMFTNCTSLTSAPALPATELAEYCYSYMFENCGSLASAPALPATTLASCCYEYMFANCGSLTSAPALPAQTEGLADYCYSGMFSGCLQLNIQEDGEAPASGGKIFIFNAPEGEETMYADGMFSYTGGTFQDGTPVAGKTYYWYIVE